MEFLNDTTTDLPIIQNVSFPATDGISICFWFLVNKYRDHYNAVVNYVSNELTKDNDLGVWLNQKEIRIYVRAGDQVVLPHHQLNSWNHFCWTWKSSGRWNAFINGTLLMSNVSSNINWKGRYPKTSGYVLLGQDTDPDRYNGDEDVINDPNQTFLGEITELYIYHTNLTADEVKSIFNHAPIKRNLVTRWEEFKGKANGKEVVEKPSPFRSLI